MSFRAPVLAPWLAVALTALSACSGEDTPTGDTGLPASGEPTAPSAGDSGSNPGVGGTNAGPSAPGSNPTQPSTGPGSNPAVTPPVNPPANGGSPSVVNTPPGVTPGPVNPMPANGGSGPGPGVSPGSAGTPVVVPGGAGPTGGAGAPGSGGQSPEPVTPVEEPPPMRPSLVTSAQGAYWRVAEATEGGTPTFSVDENTTYQEWLGFGGTFNEAGWDALLVLDEAERQRAIKLLFSRNEGANFAWGRLPIGASDYAMDRYSLDDTPDDYTMESFSIERDKELLIPYIRAALAVKPDIRLWGSPWSPPAWMKANQNMNGGRLRDEPQVLQALALYLARFVEDYEAEGIDIEQIMPQNEPGYETNYPSCLWTADLLREFVGEYLGPTFADRGTGAGIWFGTMSAPEDTAHINAVLQDANALQYVDGFGLQWNTMGSTGMLASNHLVMQTEHKCGNYRFMPETYNSQRPPNDHAYGEESWGLIRDWVKAGVHSYSAWNMVLDSQGENLDGWLQNALLTVDRGSATLTETPAYYVFRHLSYFVDPGAIRVGTSGNVDALAFKNPDGSIATIVYNSNGSAQQMTLGVGGSNLQFEVPGRGWASVFWQGG